MRNLLRTTLGRSLRDLPPLDRLTAAWPVACGSAMAGRGEIVAFTDGIVQVQVVDASWLSQMLSMRSVLEHDLARIAQVKVAGIHFEVRKQTK